MASASSSVTGLPLEQLALYHAVDPILSSVFIFHGPVTTANSTISSSRIQAHIFAPSGLQSYPRITISPAAPLYAAVNYLPRDKQGDEVYRGLAVCLLKYFSEIPESVRDGLVMVAQSGKQSSSKLSQVFDETHAADLANKMTRVENSAAVVHDLRDAFADRIVPWIDIDLVLPAGSIKLPSPSPTRDSFTDSAIESNSNPTSPVREKFSDRFGKYSSLIEALGEPVFLPTAKLRRAPSQPANLSRSKMFSASQKEALRLSMCEVVDTEERFVHKMYDLVHNVATQFRQRAMERPPASTSPDEIKLSKLFPSCLNEILDVNMGFLEAIRHVLEQTEREALTDISNDTPLEPAAFPRDSAGRKHDSMGILEFGRCLLDWFPQFSGPYGEYMHAHTGFSATLNTFLNDQHSSFSKRVQETGEQKMRSLLMEPIQRLPRYSLLIDAMTSSLPLTHPAVKPLLKARDIITEICSLDSYLAKDHSENLQRLQGMVQAWPNSITPIGRLVTAADVFTLSPPFKSGASGSRGNFGMLLVYTDYLIILTKSLESNLTARGLCTELEKPRGGPQPDLVDPAAPLELTFSQAIPLTKVRCAQSKCGRILYLASAENFLRNERARAKNMLVALEPITTYEGKTGKLVEEITKARIEGRFPEDFRERGKWSLHNPKGNAGSPGTLISVLEEDVREGGIPKSPSTVKIIFDGTKPSMAKELNTAKIEVIVSISSCGDSQYQMDLDTVVGNSSSDTVPAHDLMSTLSKRLQSLFRPLSQPRNPLLTDVFLHTNFNILRVVAEHILGHAKMTKSFRPPSPTKLLSSIWGSGQSKDTILPPKALPPLPSMNVPVLQPTLSNQSQTSFSSLQGGGITVSDENSDQIQQLEKVFTAYVLAIRSRSGNIVGRVLRSRDRVDAAAVNELYNTLLEDNENLQAAAEAPVDVLVVAFEMFISKAWEEMLGPIIPQNSLELILEKFNGLFPGDFEDFFRAFLSEMTPQSRRALTSLVRLLAELLDSSGNDGDRGALTALFSEIITEVGDSRQSIPLLDRLVEDFDRLFDETVPSGLPLEGTLIANSTNGLGVGQSNTGSMSSNTSSFRKRFGFGLNRENSKVENESKVSSIIRSLSKSKGSGESGLHGSGSTKISLMRSKSTDVDSRIQSLLRPMSREKPLLPSVFSLDDDSRRPTSAHSNAPSLQSIGEENIPQKHRHPKKKRRSSLSDLKPLSGLKPLESVDVAPLFSPQNPRKAVTRIAPSRIPAAPSTPTKPSFESNDTSNIQTPRRLGSPARVSPPVRQIPSVKKENIPVTPKATPNERAVNRRTASALSSPQVTRKRADTQPSGGSVRFSRPRENSTSVIGGPRPQITTSPKMQRLRMQNPQKLRERVQNEKKALATAETSLQMELSSISDELASSRLPTPKTRPTSSGRGARVDMTSPSSTSTSAALASRVRTLEGKIAAINSNLGARATSLENDIENSLLVSERRARKLDELYRDASAENEALYARFNGELSKMTRDIRLGAADEGLKKQLKDSLDEVARVKKENMRLKREIGGLKAQQLGLTPLEDKTNS